MRKLIGWLIGSLLAFALVSGPPVLLLWIFPGPWYQPLVIGFGYAMCIVAALLLWTRPWSFPRKELS
jgi:hypothetical protein